MGKPSTKCAGIDVSKQTLAVAIHASGERFDVSNDVEGHELLIRRLRAARVTRVGLEASGNYEARVVRFLRQHRVAVVVLNPGQVHGFRRYKNKRAKTDPIDATLIAAVTASFEIVKAPPDERLAAFAEHLTLVDQITEDVSRLKTRRDRFETKVHLAYLEREIKRLSRQRKVEIAKLKAAISKHADLAHKLTLLLSIPSIGDVLALSLVVRMPELGQINRAEAAALVGVAPYDNSSGDFEGARHIAGGRHRIRRVLYLAAFAGSQKWNPILLALYKRLTAAGKHHKVAVTACARKLLEIANAILERGTPWREATA